jgi:hypothetical protein
MITPLFWDQEVLPTRQFNQLNIADVNALSFNIVEKSSTVNEDINEAPRSKRRGRLALSFCSKLQSPLAKANGEDDRKKPWLPGEGSDNIFSPMVPSERPD